MTIALGNPLMLTKLKLSEPKESWFQNNLKVCQKRSVTRINKNKHYSDNQMDLFKTPFIQQAHFKLKSY